MRHLLLLLFFQIPASAYSQLSGTVTLEYAGVQFTIPDGWIGQQTEGGIVLGSHTEAGTIILVQHESRTLSDLRREAINGIQDQEDIQLTIEGSPEALTDNSIGAVYVGSMQGYPMKAYAIGLINPHGKGVSVFSITTPEVYSSRQEQLAKEVAGSLRFSEAKTSAATGEWKKALTNARLTYMESYSSQGGGYADKVVIDLCAAGYFTHSRNYSLSVDTGGTFGNDNSASGGSGSWDIVQDASGNAVLELRFRNGETLQYSLQYVNEQTLLNGTRYFRTYDAACQ